MPTGSVTEKSATEIEALIEAWRPKLSNVSAQAAHAKPDSERWAISEVIGHLVDSACNNHQRFVRAQFSDELVFPKYEQNQWVSAANYKQADWGSLVGLWYHYNRQLASLIRNVDPQALATKCTIEPYEPCTLEFLITDYVAHLRHHLDILERRLEEADE